MERGIVACTVHPRRAWKARNPICEGCTSGLQPGAMDQVREMGESGGQDESERVCANWRSSG